MWGLQACIPQKLSGLVMMATTKRERALIFTHIFFYFKTLQSHFVFSNRRNLLLSAKKPHGNESEKLLDIRAIN